MFLGGSEGLKAAFGATALILTFIAFYPYYRGIIRREVSPHVFTWFIWAAGTVIVFMAQLSDGGGMGAWPIGVSGLLTGGVAVLALRYPADTSIVRMDWMFLVLALSALPLWFLTSTPLSAVIILTLVDLAMKARHSSRLARFAMALLFSPFRITLGRQRSFLRRSGWPACSLSR